jgi:tRNA G10  N-methylase Trm11
MYSAILGRQPAIGVAELEAVYGQGAVKWLSSEAALVETETFSIERLGGTQKAGRVVLTIPGGAWHETSNKIVHHYTAKWSAHAGKITFGMSVYGFAESPRSIQKTGLLLKQALKKSGVSLRLIPNTNAALNTATSHHNKLGLAENKVELLVIRASDGRVLVAESTGAQNITAYTRRDQNRPKRDPFVGMLPPKLAQIIINLASPTPNGLDTERFQQPQSAQDVATMSGREHLQPPFPLMRTQGEQGAKPFLTRHSGHARTTPAPRLLDPFCGTGVILQEAAIMGYDVYGTDLSEKMIDYSRQNLDWLSKTHRLSFKSHLELADATDATWQQPINAVACETYLGQPFSAPPAAEKLTAVVKNCNHIISSFLQNLAPQLQPGTPLCIAVPAWRSSDGSFTHLPLIRELKKLDFTPKKFTAVSSEQLLYYREDQVVARELLVLTKA